VKTLAIRLDQTQHAQLTVLAQLEGVTVTDAIRQAIETHIETKRLNPLLSERAEAALANIDQEVADRRAAIAGLFGETPSPTGAEPTADRPTGRSGRSKAGGSTS
jgi:hypothetical protein